MYKPKVIAIILLMFLLLIVLVQNAEPTEFSFLFWDVLVSKFMLILFSVLLGFTIGIFAPRLLKIIKRRDTKE